MIKYWFRRFFFSHKMISLRNKFSCGYSKNYHVSIYEEDSFFFCKNKSLFYNTDNKISILYKALQTLKYHIKWE